MVFQMRKGHCLAPFPLRQLRKPTGKSKTQWVGGTWTVHEIQSYLTIRLPAQWLFKEALHRKQSVYEIIFSCRKIFMSLDIRRF